MSNKQAKDGLGRAPLVQIRLDSVINDKTIENTAKGLVRLDKLALSLKNAILQFYMENCDNFGPSESAIIEKAVFSLINLESSFDEGDDVE